MPGRHPHDRERGFTQCFARPERVAHPDPVRGEPEAAHRAAERVRMWCRQTGLVVPLCLLVPTDLPVDAGDEGLTGSELQPVGGNVPADPHRLVERSSIRRTAGELDLLRHRAVSRDGRSP